MASMSEATSQLKLKDSIAAYLLKIIFGLYFIVTLIVTVIQLTSEYNQTKEDVFEEVRRLEQTFAPGLGALLWAFSDDQLLTLMQGMSQVAIIEGVKIQNIHSDEPLAIGTILDDQGNYALYNFEGNPIDIRNRKVIFGHEFPITYLDEHGEKHLVGKGTLYSSNDIVIERVQYGFILIVVNSVIKTFALWFIFLAVIKKVLAKPLTGLTNNIVKIRLDNLENQQIKTFSSRQDELNLLGKAFNNMMQRLSSESQQNEALSDTFQKFVPKQFLNRIAVEGLDKIELGKAETETITVLFSDIRSFTNLSETMTPQDLLNFLNEYLHRMNHPIHEYHGFIDKFIGDAIMALFDRSECSSTDGVRAAIGMIKAANEYNLYRVKKGYSPIGLGIGVHTGEVIIGTMGSKDRMDSTVLGDNVNLASRIEGLSKRYGVQIVISSETHCTLEDASILCRELDFIAVKGKKKPVRIFEVFSGDEFEVIEKKQQILQSYSEGLSNFHARKWDDSMRLFQQCLQVYPEDIVSKIYFDRCHQYKENPPPDDWDGVLRMVQK